MNVDSDVKVAYPRENNDTYTIDDVYNQAFEKNGDLKSFTVGSYTKKKGYQVNEAVNRYVVRRNLTGIQFDTLIVVSYIRLIPKLTMVLKILKSFQNLMKGL